MKKVLIASYYFPPHSHPGVQRPLKFAKFLPLFGYQPLVTKCSNVQWKDYDYETFNKEVKEKLIVHGIPAPNFDSIGKPISTRTIVAKGKLKAQSLLLEDRLDWSFGGRFDFTTYALENNISLVFTTGPPHSVHFIGRYLKAKLKLPWVADFRDPMAKQFPTTDLSLFSNLSADIKRRTFITLFERAIVNRCDALITTTDSISDDLRIRYPKHANKIFTITNGFDEKDFDDIEPRAMNSVGLKLVYTGRFWQHQTPDVFFTGLERAIDQIPALKEELTVTFVGPYDPRFNAKMDSGKLSGVISAQGPVSHREAIAYQLGSDANLLILSYLDKRGGTPLIPGKIFEYLRAGRPILAVVPKGPARKLIEETNLGYLAYPNDPDEVARAIISLYTDWKSGNLFVLKPSPSVIEKFNRRNLTESLAGIFNKCLS